MNSTPASAQRGDASTDAAAVDDPNESGDEETTNDNNNNTINNNDETDDPQHRIVTAVTSLDSLYGLREVGRDALCWQLSSAKPGNGVEQLRDGQLETYWQSDGTQQPHWVQVHFARRVAVSHVCLYLDFGLDESYTPRRVQVHAGMTAHDMQVAWQPPSLEVELQEPVGWCILPLSSAPDALDCIDANLHDDEDEMDENNVDALYSGNRRGMLQYNSRKVVRAHMFRISILSMHQNGRDTHLRQVQLYGPRMSVEGPKIPVAPVRKKAAIVVDAMETTNDNDNKMADNDDDDDDDSWVEDMQLMSLGAAGVIR